MAALTQENHRSLLQYHAALRQFLSMSAAPAKANPNRAAKARGKLLKLSASQFFELSTDVYDELQRRIDESQDEPDFLLPLEYFHPKRNEARQKLGSLQPGRFRDLVSDIYYEIERRDLHSQNDVELAETTASVSLKERMPRLPSPGSKPQGAVKTLQPTTVIPTKADMTWSSDEEHDGDDSLKILNSSHTKTRSLEISKGDLPSVVTTGQYSTKPPPANTFNGGAAIAGAALVGAASLAGSHHVASESPRSYTSTKNNVVTSPQQRHSNLSKDDAFGDLNNFSNEPRVQRGLSTSKNRNKDREIELLLAEGTKMDQKITDLEQENLLLQSKADKVESENLELQQMKDNLTSKIQKLESELTKKDVTIASLRQSASPKELYDPSNDSAWKLKHDELMVQKVEDFLALDTISEQSVKEFVAKNGLVPIGLVTQLHSSVKSFLLKLYSQTTKHDVSTLFDEISHIADHASKIASYAPHSEKSELVRAAVSHAITSTRYFSLYSELLPKLIIQSAVSEVAYSVCDLVSDVSLTMDASTIGNDDYDSSVAPNPRPENAFSGNVESPVRPLRMTKKSESGSRTVSSSTPKQLNLTINTKGTPDRVETKPFRLGQDSSTKSAERLVNGGAGALIDQTPSKIFPIITTSRYSPEMMKTPTDIKPSPGLGLQKSSSQNILSKVRQFEQQDQTPTTSPSPKKALISPLSDNVVGLFGKRKSSETVPAANIDSAVEAKNAAAVSAKPFTVPPTTGIADTKDSNSAEKSPYMANATAENNAYPVIGVPESNGARLVSPVKNTKVFSFGKGGTAAAAAGTGIAAASVGATSRAASPSKTRTSHDPDNDEVDIDDFKSSLMRNKTKQQAQATHDFPDDLKTANDTQLIENKATGSIPDIQEDDLNYSPLDERKSLKAKDNPRSVDAGSVPHNVTNGSEVEPNGKSDPWRLDSLVKDVMSGPPLKSASDSSRSSPVDGETAYADAVSGDEDDILLQNSDVKVEAKTKLRGVKNAEITVPSVKSEPVHSGGSQQDESDGTRHRFEDEEFDVDEFDIGDPDNSLSELLLYLEHQTVKVISTIQALLSAIKLADSTKGDLRGGSKAINDVVSQMVEATSTAMNQSRNAQLKEHGRWVVDSLSDCGRRMDILCTSTGEDDRDEDYADKSFKQRLAGIAFDVAKCTKELVKSVEEANLKEEIAHLNARLG